MDFEEMPVINHHTSAVVVGQKRIGIIPRSKYREVIDFIMANGGIAWLGVYMLPTPPFEKRQEMKRFILDSTERS